MRTPNSLMSLPSSIPGAGVLRFPGCSSQNRSGHSFPPQVLLTHQERLPTKSQRVASPQRHGLGTERTGPVGNRTPRPPTRSQAIFFYCFVEDRVVTIAQPICPDPISPPPPPRLPRFFPPSPCRLLLQPVNLFQTPRSS